MSAPTVQPLIAKTILARTITAHYIRPQPFGISDGDQFDPRLLFTNNEQGGWYDPSDFSSMYQDSAGTTPVTALGQPVGLMLDKRLGLPLGPNIVTNGTFSNGTTGWTNNGGFATTFAAGSHDGKATALHVITPSNSGGAVQSQMTAGKVYSVTYDIKVIAGAVYVGIGANTVGGVHTTTDAANWRTVTRSVYVASDAAIRVYSSTTNTDFWITNISFREVQGNHATQSTAGNRPTVEARVNWLLNSSLAGGGAAPTGWSMPGVTGDSVPVASIYGNADGAVAYLQSGTNVRPFLALTTGTLAANTTYTLSMLVEAVSGLQASHAISAVALPTGATISHVACSANPAGTSVGTLVPGVLELRITIAATAGTVGVRIGMGVNANNTGSIQFSRPQLEEGTKRTTYQRVTTATDYADIGAPRYLSFDGATSNRWLQTSSVNFTSTDKMSVWFGVGNMSATTTGILCELSASSTVAGGISIYAPRTGGVVGASITGAGGTRVGSSFSAAATARHVVFIAGDMAASGHASEVSARLNAAAPVLSSMDTTGDPTGAFGNHIFYLGRRGGSTLPFEGRLYGLIVRGSASNAAQIAAAEAWMNSKTRAY